MKQSIRASRHRVVQMLIVLNVMVLVLVFVCLNILVTRILAVDQNAYKVLIVHSIRLASILIALIHASMHAAQMLNALSLITPQCVTAFLATLEMQCLVVIQYPTMVRNVFAHEN